MAQTPQQMHAALHHYYCEFDAEALIAGFARPDQTPRPGLVGNFLGMWVEPAVCPPVLTGREGSVEGPPHPGNWHADIAEWGAALYSVAQARDLYRIVELGCGWGCWIANMGVAARARGLAVDLIGVEGDAGHLKNAARTLEINGFDPEAVRLHHGVAAPRRGHAIFPVHPEPGTHWGAEPVFYPPPEVLKRARGDAGVQVLDCLPFDEIAGDGTGDGASNGASDRIVDLLHIDIQGGEADYVSGNLGPMARQVRRVLIGTHSRVLEGRLIGLFQTAGWRLEMERPAIMPLHGGVARLHIDGVQMWANPALTGAPTA